MGELIMALLLGLNGVRTVLDDAIDDSTTTVPVVSALTPWKTPPDPDGEHYYLTIIDSSNPTKWERVKVTDRAGAGPYDLTVERNVDSNSGGAHSFNEGAVIQWVPGAEEFVEAGDFKEQPNGSYTLTSNTLTLDLATGFYFEVEVDDDIEDIVLDNVPDGWLRVELNLTQDATGDHSITYPQTILWPGGEAPEHSTAAEAVDHVTLLKSPGSSDWLGINSGVAFAPIPVPAYFWLAVGWGGSAWFYQYNTEDYAPRGAPSTSPGSTVRGIAYRPNGSIVALAVASPPYIRTYNTSNMGHFFTWDAPSNGSDAVAWSPDGQYLAIGNRGASDKVLVLDSQDDWKKVATITNPAASPKSIAYNHDGTLLAVASGSSPYVEIYNTSTWDKLSNPGTLPAGDAWAVAFSPDGSLLVVGHNGSPFFTIYDTSDWSKLANPASLPAIQVYGAAFSPDGSMLAVVGGDGLDLYNTNDWSKVAGEPEFDTWSEDVAWAPDGSLLAIAHQGSPYITIYETATWTKIADPGTLPSGTALCVTFSPEI
jgi:WD40 repeat protein